jgi:hypothetical protein
MVISRAQTSWAVGQRSFIRSADHRSSPRPAGFSDFAPHIEFKQYIKPAPQFSCVLAEPPSQFH